MSNELLVPVRQNGSIDWITATTNSDKTGADWFRLFELVQAGKDKGRSLPGLWQNKTIRGYEGAQGDCMFWGKNQRQGYLVTVWGEGCDSAWSFLAPSARRLSRVDLAVTVELDKPKPTLARNAYLDNKSDTQRKYTLWENSKDGVTLYVGSRQSTMYGRLYDKGVMWGQEPGKIWRYEVELKDKPRNKALLRSMLDRWKVGGVVDEDVCSYVHEWFAVRGISPQFLTGRRQLPKLEYDVTLSTTEKKLRWLTQQVAPTLQRLIDVGLGDEALLALGLDRDQLPMWDNQSVRGTARASNA